MKIMSNHSAHRVLDQLGEAARLLALVKGCPEFSDLIEHLVERGRQDPEADMVCSMLYAARESVENHP